MRAFYSRKVNENIMNSVQHFTLATTIELFFPWSSFSSFLFWSSLAPTFAIQVTNWIEIVLHIIATGTFCTDVIT